MTVKFLMIHSFLLISYGIDTSALNLKLLHVLSANKFYVPDYDYSSTKFEVPKNLTYEYFLKNSVDIPNSVKLNLFKLGEVLRKYYKDFLGSLYLDEAIEMRTTEFPVSIMAGELINAGLWPPVGSQIWNEDLLWQPIPFVYRPAEEDTVLLGTECPNFKAELKKILKNHNVTAEQKAILNYINKESQIEVHNAVDASLLYLALENSLELNQTHPELFKNIYPSKKFLDLTLSAYDLLSQTIIQKRLNGGSFLKSIIADSKNYIDKTMSNDRKINIYSGDERNFAGVTKILNISTHHLPNAGSAIIFELSENSTDYFVKILFYHGATDVDSLDPYKLENCDLLCPIEKFIELVSDVLPENELSLCGSKSSPASANIFTVSNILLIVSLLIVNY